MIVNTPFWILWIFLIYEYGCRAAITRLFITSRPYFPSVRSKSTTLQSWNSANPSTSSNVFVPTEADKTMGMLIASEYILEHYMSPLQCLLHVKKHSWQTIPEAFEKHPKRDRIMKELKIPDVSFVEAAVELIKERNDVAHPREHDLRVVTTDRIVRISDYVKKNRHKRLLRQFGNLFRHLPTMPHSTPRATQNRPLRLLSEDLTDSALMIIKLFHILDRKGSPKSLKFSPKSCRHSIWTQEILAGIPSKQFKKMCSFLSELRNQAAHPTADYVTFRAYSEYVLNESKYYEPLLSKVKKCKNKHEGD